MATSIATRATPLERTKYIFPGGYKEKPYLLVAEIFHPILPFPPLTVHPMEGASEHSYKLLFLGPQFWIPVPSSSFFVVHYRADAPSVDCAEAARSKKLISLDECLQMDKCLQILIIRVNGHRVIFPKLEIMLPGLSGVAFVLIRAIIRNPHHKVMLYFLMCWSCSHRLYSWWDAIFAKRDVMTSRVSTLFGISSNNPCALLMAKTFCGSFCDRKHLFCRQG